MDSYGTGFVIGILATSIGSCAVDMTNDSVTVKHADGKSACEAYKQAANKFDRFITANGERVTLEVKKDDGTTLCKFQHIPKASVEVPVP